MFSRALFHNIDSFVFQSSVQRLIIFTTIKAGLLVCTRGAKMSFEPWGFSADNSTTSSFPTSITSSTTKSTTSLSTPRNHLHRALVDICYESKDKGVRDG